MIRYLGYNEVLDIYREQISLYGGFGAIRDNNALLSTIANPQRQFAGRDLYPSLASKASIIIFSLIKNSPFVDGNKRVAFIWGRIFLRLNGFDVESVEKYYEMIMKISRGGVKQEDITDWFEVSIDTLANLALRLKGRSK